MHKGKLLYEGKAKRIYQTDGELYLMEYKNTATAFNGEKKEEFAGKGALNCAICVEIYTYLESNGIGTHFVRKVSSTEMLVKRVTIIPLEVIMRNVAAGSFSRKYGVEEGSLLKKAAQEFSYKNDALGDPMINESQILSLGLATETEISEILAQTTRINALLTKFFAAVGLRLIDFKLEFGRDDNGAIILADEISPDTCRLWDSVSGEKLDKDRFRRGMGGLTDAYEEVWQRLYRAQERSGLC